MGNKTQSVILKEKHIIALIKKSNLLSVPFRAHDTVGAVAVDRAGNVACATSTGGIRNKMLGRVGDSPIIGKCFILIRNKYVDLPTW